MLRSITKMVKEGIWKYHRGQRERPSHRDVSNSDGQTRGKYLIKVKTKKIRGYRLGRTLSNVGWSRWPFTSSWYVSHAHFIGKLSVSYLINTSDR